MCGYFTRCQHCGQVLFYHEDCDRCSLTPIWNLEKSSILTNQKVENNELLLESEILILLEA